MTARAGRPIPTTSNGSTGSASRTTLAVDRGRLVVLLGLLLVGPAGACSTGTGHAAPPLGRGGAAAPKPDGKMAPPTAKPDGGAPELGVASEDDCAAICAKLLRCQHGPWDTEEDCRDACDGAIDDATSSRTYRCAAKATTCAKLKRCGR
jgi:hypothetical protein